MISIRELINKIKWDPAERADEYDIFYLDRVKNMLLKINLKNILEIEGEFIKISKDKNINYIPLHRIKKVTKKDKVIWSRNY